MSVLRVDTDRLTLTFNRQVVSCTVGRNGPCRADQKREGDGHTPVGNWPIRVVLFRPGRSAPAPGLKLPWRWIGLQDGWSDDPVDPAYNRPVRLPHPFSAEALIRDDPLYDIIVILGHNDKPPLAVKGSAIFLHICYKNRATEGCIAIDRTAMDALLPTLESGDVLEII
ncbi:L,D-transpeptidase family protein [Parasphingorhabdus cellanae]|uniref:L,D-transpeptidase family protein n=1 Tax=Parasphingorhabdus cellanae TaxID=2806553 RepID=A0ABX7T8Z6_9SPHN|nr:L,D-transpeptidase family protein [Parasphingorhabdus cellanae]QTD56984.1 L,D-transpeptidase family protein [Parasphingorhabdus cellanae]